MTSRLSIPGLMILSATLRRTGCLLLGDEHEAHAALADLLHQLVRPDHGAGTLVDPRWPGGDRGRFKESAEADLGLQKGQNTGLRAGVGTRFGQESVALAGVGNFQGGVENVAFVHGVSGPSE